jgi:hypothetical protein
LDFNLSVEEIYRWVDNEDMAAFLQAREAELLYTDVEE